MEKQKGFNLIEIIISLAVGLVLFAGVMSVFSGMNSTTRQTTSYGELQENGRFVLNLLTDDLLRVNFWGDLAENFNFQKLTAIPVALAADCVGGGVNNGSFPLAIGHFRRIWGALAVTASPINCINDAKLNSDIIQIKRVLGLPVVGATAANRYYLTANSDNGVIFAGGGATPVLNDSRTWEYQHHVYYVRNENQGSNTVPVLMMGTLRNGVNPPIDFQPIVDGIEVIHFMYGVDTDGDGDANAFIPASQMTEPFWDEEVNNNIVAVQIYVLARDILPDAQYTNNSTYHLGDLDIAANGDNYHRQLFSATVRLPNARLISWP